MATIRHAPPVQTVVKTVNGECTVKIELEINVNLNELETVAKNNTPKEEDVWAIPDFNSNEIFQFGKEEKT